MTTVDPGLAAGAYRVRRHEWLHVFRSAVRTRRGMIGLALTLFVVAVAVIGPFVQPHTSTEFITAPFAKPSAQAKLGGDVLGRDVLSRTLEGGWKLLLMAIAATALGIGLGAVAGVSAAYLRGRSDAAIMRTVDVFLAFPQLVFALLLVSIIGPKVWLLIVAVGLSHAPQVARVLRATALEVSERDFVKAVEITGVKRNEVMRKEILPNLITPLMVESGLRLTYSIIIIAGLSFIGFGIQPPGANWGLMINENRIGLTQNYWAVVAPAALIALLTVGVNTLTDAIARVALGVERAEVVMATEAVTAADVTG
ncbi:MAG TPA: ABC transporter permease [Candidatus Limnocylindrales bacterium]